MHITEGKLPAAVQRICRNDTQPVLDHGLPAFRLHAQHESAALVASQTTCSVHVSLDIRQTFTKIAGLSFGTVFFGCMPTASSCNLVPLSGAHLNTWLRDGCRRMISAGVLRIHGEISRGCCGLEGIRMFTREALNVDSMYR